jgi:hypothetical protein
LSALWGKLQSGEVETSLSRMRPSFLRQVLRSDEATCLASKGARKTT